MRTAVKFASWILIAGGAYLGWRGASDYYQSVNSQEEQALAWEEQDGSGNEVASKPAFHYGKTGLWIHTSPALPKGASLAKLSIPRLDATLYVVEGTDDKDLKRGPGHLEGSVMPGADGNCVIAGHRDTHFRVLKNVVKGDLVLVQSRQGTYKYRVSGLSVVSPDNTQCLRPTTTPVLNLVTCFPFEYVGSAPRRFVVHADLISPEDPKS